MAPSKYRPRVDAFGVRDGKILTGVYSDHTPGTFGGGIESGESPEQAGLREFLEEAGRKLINLQKIPVPPFTQTWVPGKSGPDNAGRRAKYKGSTTHMVLGTISGRKRKPSDTSGLQDVRYRKPSEVIRDLENSLAFERHPENKARLKHRIQAIRAIEPMLAQTKTAFYDAGIHAALRFLGATDTGELQ